MKKFLMHLGRVICRFVAAVLWQLVWLVPFWGLCWYGKKVLPGIIRSQFGVEQAQRKFDSLDQLAELMKQNTSLSNPTAVLHYMSAQMSKISMSVKLNTLEATSYAFETLAVWVVNLLWIAALVYAVFRVFKAYQAKTHEYALACQVVRQLQPDFVALQNEIAALRGEIYALKHQGDIPQITDAEQNSLSHE